MIVSSNGFEKIKEYLTEKVFFGHEPTPELIAILLVYFVQGILGLARLAISFFLKDELGLSPAEVSALVGIAALPWMVKPLFGFISDGLPIFGYRRRPYLILSGFLGVLSWVLLATIVHSAWAATIAIALSSLSVAFSDVIVDSLVVERARKESVGDAGSLQSICWGLLRLVVFSLLTLAALCFSISARGPSLPLLQPFPDYFHRSVADYGVSPDRTNKLVSRLASAWATPSGC